jgi:hypothetical protein
MFDLLKPAIIILLYLFFVYLDKFLIIKAKYKVAASVDISISFYVLLNNILAII